LGGAFTTCQAAQRAPQKTTGLPLAGPDQARSLRHCFFGLFNHSGAIGGSHWQSDSGSVGFRSHRAPRHALVALALAAFAPVGQFGRSRRSGAAPSRPSKCQLPALASSQAYPLVRCVPYRASSVLRTHSCLLDSQCHDLAVPSTRQVLPQLPPVHRRQLLRRCSTVLAAALPFTPPPPPSLRLFWSPFLRLRVRASEQLHTNRLLLL
jgi:hypothetical protein